MFSLFTYNQGVVLLKVGDRISLWLVDFFTTPGTIQITREILVSITEEKTGAPRQFSREPSSFQSLKGIGDDGRLYEKHWESWPESQNADFTERWSQSYENNSLVTPFEAYRIYNDVARVNRVKQALRLLGPDGSAIKPNGDKLAHCKTHDMYSYESEFFTEQCLLCRMAIRGRIQAERSVTHNVS